MTLDYQIKIGQHFSTHLNILQNNIISSSSPLKFKNQDWHDLFLETLSWIYLYPAKN